MAFCYFPQARNTHTSIINPSTSSRTPSIRDFSTFWVSLSRKYPWDLEWRACHMEFKSSQLVTTTASPLQLRSSWRNSLVDGPIHALELVYKKKKEKNSLWSIIPRNANAVFICTYISFVSPILLFFLVCDVKYQYKQFISKSSLVRSILRSRLWPIWRLDLIRLRVKAEGPLWQALWVKFSKQITVN